MKRKNNKIINKIISAIVNILQHYTILEIIEILSVLTQFIEMLLP